MKLFKNLKNIDDNMNKRNNFLIDIAEELSLITWVTIVFLLIVLSYVVNEYKLYETSQLNLYEQISISENQFINKI